LELDGIIGMGGIDGIGLGLVLVLVMVLTGATVMVTDVIAGLVRDLIYIYFGFIQVLTWGHWSYFIFHV
tara:strand:- start:645 stop:851 length:207 start_codon:yes stop_codon:yes gene_type:complete